MTKKEKKKDKKKAVGQYSLGEVLGKGGFGVVYKGMNTETGDIVAVKRISLKNCSKDQVDTIQSEINLLKKLNHTHIVKYIDHKQTKNKLYIIIEFIENGSLQDLVKTFGKLKESVVSTYIGQVLEGLKYLHSEGVIHRDIKGANILKSKDLVKLADFGVATTLADVDADSPVGTPYWMAPEIIEMNPSTPAADIWSVGCTVIELLTGDPPYFNLDPMPALYRIVQDEHPPLPTDISPACKDFLLQCFQKDPNLRKAANKLINHQWLKSAKKIAEEEEEQQNGDISKRKSTRPMESPSLNNSVNPLPSTTSNQNAAKININDSLSIPGTSDKDQVLNKYKDDDDDWGEMDNDEPLGGGVPALQIEKQEDPRADGNSFATELKDSKINQILQGGETKLSKLADDDDDFGDVFGDGGDELDIAARLEKFVKGDAENEEDDEENDMFELEFDNIEMDFSVTQRDIDLKIENDIVSIINTKIKPHIEESIIFDTCKTLIQQFRQHSHLKAKISQRHGPLPFLDMLYLDNASVIQAILELINEITRDNKLFQETLCLVGAMPAIMKFSNIRYPTEIRKQVSLFIREAVLSSSLSLQMFIACQGLPVIVEFLAHTPSDYQERRDIIFSAIDDIWQIFTTPYSEFSKMISKKDFTALFFSAKLMYNFSKALLSLIEDKTPEAEAMLTKMITLTQILAQNESGRTQMAEETVLQRWLNAFQNLTNYEHKLTIMKMIKTLCQDPSVNQNQKLCDTIERLAFPQLISLLGDKNESMTYPAIGALFGICYLNPKRLDRAAELGCIPYLKTLIENNNALKQAAFTLICEIASKGQKRSRQELWNCGGVEFMLKLLDVPIWQDRSLEALASWFNFDKSIENELVKRTNVDYLVNTFTSLQSNNKKREFLNLIQPLYKILSLSPKLNKVLSESRDLIPALAHSLNELVVKLKHRRVDVHIILTELRICKSLYKYTENPKYIMSDIYPIIKQLAIGSSVPELVQELAKELYIACDTNVQL